MIDHLHRGMTHTAESLAALPDRELDAIVAKVVFGIALEIFRGKTTSWYEDSGGNQIPPYSETYEYMGMVIDWMQKLGFHVNMGTYLNGKAHAHFGVNYFDKVNEAETLSRTIAIASILAVQAINEPAI
jgi:hypothetical protein